MAEPEDTLRNSPVDFDSAVAFALQPVMRRLIILYLVGSILVPVGVSVMINQPFTAVLGLDTAIGLAIALVGATFLFGGLVGAAFKVVTDANLLAESVTAE